MSDGDRLASVQGRGRPVGFQRPVSAERIVNTPPPPRAEMGSTTSCCVAGSPKLRRNAHSRLESYHQESDLSREETGCNLQHISDRENVDGKKKKMFSVNVC